VPSSTVPQPLPLEHNARWKTVLLAWAVQGVGTTYSHSAVTRSILTGSALPVAWPPTEPYWPTASYYDTNLLHGVLTHGVIDDCCIGFGFPQHRRLVIFHFPAFQRFHLICINIGPLEPREQSASELLGCYPLFSFLYPVSRSREPGHKPFLERACWIPILFTASIAQHHRLPRQLLHFLCLIILNRIFQWPCRAGTLLSHVLRTI
jgi:hypothetical protein